MGNTTFHDKAFAIYPSDKANNIDIGKNKVVKITPVEFNLYKPVGFFYIGKFIADVSINNKTKRIEGNGKESSFFALNAHVSFINLTDNTFLDFAKNLVALSIRDLATPSFFKVQASNPL